MVMPFPPLTVSSPFPLCLAGNYYYLIGNSSESKRGGQWEGGRCSRTGRTREGNEVGWIEVSSVVMLSAHRIELPFPASRLPLHPQPPTGLVALLASLFPSLHGSLWAGISSPLWARLFPSPEGSSLTQVWAGDPVFPNQSSSHAAAGGDLRPPFWSLSGLPADMGRWCFRPLILLPLFLQPALTPSLQNLSLVWYAGAERKIRYSLSLLEDCTREGGCDVFLC